MYFHNVFFGYNRSDLCDIFTFIIRILVYLMTRCTMFNYECKFTLEKWSVFNIVLYFDFLNSFSLNLWYSFFGNVRRLRLYDFHASSLLYYTLYQEIWWSLHPDKGKGGAVSIWNEIQWYSVLVHLNNLFYCYLARKPNSKDAIVSANVLAWSTLKIKIVTLEGVKVNSISNTPHPESNGRPLRRDVSLMSR